MSITHVKRRCTKHRTNGEKCIAVAVKGKDCCVTHGGKTPSGIASPHFKDGRYCKSLPARLAETFASDFNDPNHLVNTSEIALYSSRIDDLIKRVDTGESGEIWKSLRATYAVAEKALNDWNRFKGTKRGEDGEYEFFQAHETMGHLIREGVEDYAAWDEVEKAVEARRRLAETEMKRLEKAGQYITAEKAMNLMAAILGLVKANVSDRQALQKIQKGIDELSTRDFSR